MTAYLIRRILLIIPTILIASVLTFFVIRIIPGDVIDLMADEQGFGGEIDREAIERQLGLDVPIHIQYFRWLGFLPNRDGEFRGILQGSLGDSLWKPMEVW